jgi:FKBP-type peptidyl-prolyl cis-trans isomerase SlyD
VAGEQELICEKPMQIAQNSVAAFHYTLTDDEGQVIDSSTGRDPLTYLHGNGHIVPGLEKQMEGRVVGDKFVADVTPEEGYGVHHVELVQLLADDSYFASPACSSRAAVRKVR